MVIWCYMMLYDVIWCYMTHLRRVPVCSSLDHFRAIAIGAPYPNLLYASNGRDEISLSKFETYSPEQCLWCKPRTVSFTTFSMDLRRNYSWMYDVSLKCWEMMSTLGNDLRTHVSGYHQLGGGIWAEIWTRAFAELARGFRGPFKGIFQVNFDKKPL